MSEHTPTPWILNGALTGPTTASHNPVCGGEEWGCHSISKDMETIAICPNQEDKKDYLKPNKGTGFFNAAFIVHACNSHETLVKHLDAAFHALRAYQYGNSDGTLAEKTADKCEAVLKLAKP